MKNKKIAYIINHVAFFESHIMPIAKIAKKNFKVILFCGQSASMEMEQYALKSIKKNKISIIKKKFSSTSINFIKELIALVSLIKSVKKFQPDIIHCATPKGILLGGLVSFILKVKSLVIFNSGMGFMYSNKLNFFHQIAKNIYIFALKKIIMKHPNKKIIVENLDDYKYLKKKYFLDTKEIDLLNGSGVDLSKFKKLDISKNRLVLMPSRVLREKGVKEFVIAANNLKKKYPNWLFVVAGSLDYKKKSDFSLEELKLFKKNKNIKFLGFVKNMIKIYKKASIVCLPSHREGFSKTLQEAAASGIPIVTTNAIGCKNAIIPGKTGELCKVNNPRSLEKKLDFLIKNKRKRIFYGKNGRLFAEKNFSVNKVLNKNIKIYNYLVLNEKKINFN
mgnify:CR=1 FL=1|tara:strand:- start:257 stop:1429 length:1173 start_codon:yes stop_codon:yes gene_type:complete